MIMNCQVLVPKTSFGEFGDSLRKVYGLRGPAWFSSFPFFLVLPGISTINVDWRSSLKMKDQAAHGMFVMVS